jgi:hypothetical protein
MPLLPMFLEIILSSALSATEAFAAFCNWDRSLQTYFTAEKISQHKYDMTDHNP